VDECCKERIEQSGSGEADANRIDDQMLSIGRPQDTYRRGVLQEEYFTLFNGAQSQARQDVGTLNNEDNRLDFVSCSSCGAAPACDAIAVDEESAESGGGQEAVLRIFRVCGLIDDRDRACLNRVGEFIYSFFCYFRAARNPSSRRACAVLRALSCCARAATPRAKLRPFKRHAEGASRGKSVVWQRFATNWITSTIAAILEESRLHSNLDRSINLARCSQLPNHKATARG
jgi:hypothetical protein